MCVKSVAVVKGPLVHINVMREKKGVNLRLEVGFSLETRRFVEKKGTC